MLPDGGNPKTYYKMSFARFAWFTQCEWFAQFASLVVGTPIMCSQMVGTLKPSLK